jgi:hypothetical protein
MVLVVL